MARPKQDRWRLGIKALFTAAALIQVTTCVCAQEYDLSRLPPYKSTQNQLGVKRNSIYIYFAPDRANGDPADPKVAPKLKEFLRYILSRQGQQDVAREGDYLPLTAAITKEQLKKLE